MNKLRFLVLIIFFNSCSKSDSDTAVYSNSNQSLIDNNNSSANDPVALTELPSGTFVFSVSAQNSTNYRVSVTDSNETQFGFDPTLKVNAGDDIVFNVNSPGHPFFLKTSTGVGTDNQISDVTNNGTDNGSIVPIAFPIIAGAGTLTTLLSLRAEYALANVILAIIINSLFVYIILKSSTKIERLLGKNGIGIIRRVFGIILLSISVKLFSTNISLIV